MVQIKDKIILVVCQLLSFFLLREFQIDVMNITILIIVISYVALSVYLDKEKYMVILFAIYLVLSCFLPSLIFFLPIVFYDFIFTKKQFICLFCLIPILFHLFEYTKADILFFFVFFALCIFFRYQSITIQKYTEEYKEYRDSASELEMELKRKNKELLEKQDYEVQNATLNERNRISREIHDNVGHMLSSSILQIGAIQAVNKDPDIEENIDILHHTLDQAMNSIRESIHDIYDESIKLDFQVKSIAHSFLFCPTTLDYDIQHNPDRQITHALISILKEALSNITKHSDATLVAIKFREHPSLYQLIIQDNGSVENIDCNISGIGIKNMQDRVSSLDGHFYINKDRGYKIFVSIPKGEE